MAEDDDALEAYFAALSQRAGTPPLGADEADAVLDLTRVVAHTSERRYAPLTAYVVGLAAGLSSAPLDALARAERVHEVAAVARDLARDPVVEAEDGGGG